MDDENTIKIAMFGGYGIDIASISHSYVTGQYGDDIESVNEKELSKVINIEGITVNLNIINTPGKDDFSVNHYPDFVLINRMILVFDISKQQSIETIIEIYNEAKECKYFRFKDVICAVAADNCHLRDEGADNLVPVEEYKKLEAEFNCKVFETSTKTGAGIVEMFTYITKRVLQDIGLIREEYENVQEKRRCSIA